MGAIISILAIFLCTTISFYVLFFTTPYTTGIQLREVSKNGIYQWTYMVLSGIGYIEYMFLESITNFISLSLRRDRNSRSVVLINSLLYIGTIFLMTQIYESAIDSMISPDVGGLNVGGNTSYDRLNDTLTIFQLFRAYAATDSIWGALTTTVITCLLYYVATVVFFSIMYGLMSQKIYEFQLISKHCTEDQIAYLLDFEADSLNIRQIPHRLLTEACNFVDSIASIKNFQICGLKCLFLVLILLFSIAKYMLIQFGLMELDITFQGLIADLIESAGTLNILLSFLITWLFTVCLCVFNRLLYKILPPSAQETITKLSTNATKAAAQIKEKRNAWSDKHDAVWLETDGQASRKENKILERADLSYQPPSEKRARQQKATVAEDEAETFSSEDPPKKKTEKRYPPKEEPQKPDHIKKSFLDPEVQRAYLQQQEELEKQYAKFKQEWDAWEKYIRENPDALPDYSEMPTWFQEEFEENSMKWITLKGL